MRTRALLPIAALLAACGDDATSPLDASIDAVADAEVSFVQAADTVLDAPGASGQGFGDPTKAVNGVHGGGAENGSVDVYSLRFPPAANQWITLGWSAGRLANGPGNDLVVFENPFDTSQGPFMDLVIVEVSRDGVNFRPLAHDYVTTDETVYVRQLTAWVGFAGKTSVAFDSDTTVDPFDRAASGGDQFDLDDIVGDDAEAVAMRADGITQVRLVTAPSRINPDTGALYVADEYSNGADIDGVFGRYLMDR